MKYVITGIVMLQFNFCCYAQSYTAVSMSGPLNNPVPINKKNNFIPADTNILPIKAISPWFVERFKISAGFFIPISNTNVKVGTNDGTMGTDIDFEDDLGVKRNVSTFLADFQWRASRRSRFDLSYYKVNRNSTYTLKKDIVFGDHTYHAGSSINSFFNTDIYRFSYGYAVVEKPKFEFGALIGAHVVGAEVGLGLNGDSAGVEISDDFRFTAPLPDFGLWGGYAFSDRIAVNAEVDYLALTIGDISGRILGYDILVSYKVLKNLDIALGYTGLSFKVDAVKSDLNGHFKWDYHGPNLTAAFSFGNKSWRH